MEPQSICFLSASNSVQGCLCSPFLKTMLIILRQSQTEKAFLRKAIIIVVSGTNWISLVKGKVLDIYFFLSPYLIAHVFKKYV